MIASGTMSRWLAGYGFGYGFGWRERHLQSDFSTASQRFRKNVCVGVLLNGVVPALGRMLEKDAYLSPNSAV